MAERICEIGAWMIGGFCTGLRGTDDMLLLGDMFGMARSIQRLMRDNATDPHFKFLMIVIDRTKGVQQDEKSLGSPVM